MNQEPKKDIEIKAATHLALVEIVVGSIGHGFKIPFTGTVLSYYQLYVSLWMIVQKNVKSIQVYNVAVIVALLKTLSPMGKKVTPMIAIVAQGFLLWSGTALLGNNILGLSFGAALLVTWSLFQSAVGYIILYGFDFFRMIEFFQNEITQYVALNVYAVLMGYVVLKIILAWVVLGIAYRRSGSTADWFLSEEKLQTMKHSILKGEKKSQASPGVRALKDLMNPFFMGGLILMVLFNYLRESSTSQIPWFVCRTLGLGFLLFYLVRSSWLIRILIRLCGKNRNFRSLIRKSRQVRKYLFESNHISN